MNSQIFIGNLYDQSCVMDEWIALAENFMLHCQAQLQFHVKRGASLIYQLLFVPLALIFSMQHSEYETHCNLFHVFASINHLSQLNV